VTATTTTRADEIARTLGETTPDAVDQIAMILRAFGTAFADEILERTMATEARGGLTFIDEATHESRRRTPGGVFFSLVKERVKAWRDYQGERAARNGQAQPKPPSEPTPPPKPVATPSPSSLPGSSTAGAAPKPGKKIDTGPPKAEVALKITVVGRPDKVIPQGDYVILAARSKRPGALPKGLPPAEGGALVGVYVSAKQWGKVAGALADPEDVVVAEGVGSLAPDGRSIVVHATQVTTKMTQRAAKGG
jgi:hypothetical protein